MSIAFEEHAGSGGVLAIHATGFCKETWRPVVRHLTGRRVVAFDQRAHGDSEDSGIPYDWWDLGRDALAVADALAMNRPIGLGHSSGAAALVMAEVLRPGTFQALVLVEPIVFPLSDARFTASTMRLAQSALRRRRSFPSEAAVLASFSGRGPFSRWDETALRSYVRGGFRDRAGERTLKCSPESESDLYRAAAVHETWDRMAEVTCSVLVMAGADSVSHPTRFVALQASRFPAGTHQIVSGATHFLPMEKPAVVAAAVLAADEPGF